MAKKNKRVNRVDSFINRFIANQYAVDIETTGSTIEGNSILQIGIVDPNDQSFEINVQQPSYTPSKFHSEPGRLDEYYKKNKINPEIAANFQSVVEENKRKYRAVLENKKAQAVSRNLLNRRFNSGANIIIHNANFEVKHFDRFFGGTSPLGYSKEYRNLIRENGLARVKDQALLAAGQISVAQARANDAARQIAVYDQIMKEARRGGAIIDTMELAKTANALAQQKKLVKNTGDLALGTNMELLAEIFLDQKELHRGVEDARQTKLVAPKLVELVEKLKRPDFNSKMLNAQEQAWVKVFNKNHVNLKVQSQTKAIKQAIDNIEAGRFHKFHSGKMATGDLGQFIDYLGRTGEFAPTQISQGVRMVDHGVAPSEIVQRAIKNLPEDYAATFSKLVGPRVNTASSNMAKIAPRIALGAVAGFAAIAIARRISGGDKDSHNTIEGLPHGYFGSQRSNTSDFGSGYKGSQAMVDRNNPVKNTGEPEDNSSLNYIAIFGTAGLYAAYKGSHYLSSNKAVNSLSYLGPVPAGFENWAQVLGREKATFGDLIFNATKRFEHSFGGLPKAFSISSLMSPTVFRDTNFKIDLTKRQNLSQEGYLSTLTGRRLLASGATEVEYKSGKLFISKGTGAGQEILSNARLYQNIHDPNIIKGSTQFSKGYTALFGEVSVGKNQPFLIGGANSSFKASLREVHAYALETTHKYLRLMDDPGKAIRDLAPDVSPSFTKFLEKTTRYIPKMGVGGAQNMYAPLPTLLARHARTALPVMLGIPALYSAASWAIKQIAPEDSVAGRAGLTGILAETARVAHMAYANVSDMTGLTSLREKAEEQAPGMTGLLPFAGMTFSFGFTGMALGSLAGISEEIFSPDKYATMLKNKKAIHEMPGFLSKIKGFSGEYTLASKYGRIGALIGATLATPMLLAGLGSSKSAKQLNEEYQGKEVAIKKGRWWEFGLTPFEGTSTLYYRPNWYNRIMDNPKQASMYDGDEPSAIGKFFRSIKDPYWEEKAHYYDRPYPVASASGEHLGIFGPLYQRTIGQVLKPTAYMHTGMSSEEYNQLQADTGSELGIPGDSGDMAYAPGLKSDIRQQMRAGAEAAGLRGFTASAIKQAFTGSEHYFEDMPVLQSSSEMDNARRDFYDLNLGGLMGFTEAYRRMIPARPHTFEYVNNIPNKMPSWMPGEDYFQNNFKTGDPFVKVPEGEYRLPGEGYATRFKELQGVNPEDYPLIHKYKILADVAMYSKEYKSARRQLMKSNMSDYEQRIFDETEAQVAEKNEKRKFIFKEDYSGVFGNYTKAVANIAQLNPIEQLTPFAPAHKYLPVMDPLSQYEESIYGKSFKMWQNPVDDFIKPFLYTSGNLIGASGIPSEIQEARDIERYFDEIKYVKFKRLEEQASSSFNPSETSRYAKNMIRNTRLGTDPYSENFNEFVLPKREREFFDAFKKMNLTDQAKVIEIAPEDVQDIYQGQFDLQLEKQIVSGELKLLDSERDKALAAIDSRRAEARARKRERQEAVMTSPSLPDENWEGWQASVDLEDVKLKYLQNEGKNFHYYNLWDDRARRIKNRQDVSAAAQSIDPRAGINSRDSLSRADMIKLANEAGISDPRVSYASSQKGVTVDVDYDSEIEENTMMREMGYVL